MVKVVDASGTLLSFLDHWRNILPYERTRRQIEDEVVIFSRAINCDAGLPLLPMESPSNPFIATGHAIQWSATLLLIMSLILIFISDGEPQRAGTVMILCLALYGLGGNLLARGRHRQRLIAGKPSFNLDGVRGWRGYGSLLLSRLAIVGVSIISCCIFAVVSIAMFFPEWLQRKAEIWSEWAPNMFWLVFWTVPFTIFLVLIVVLLSKRAAQLRQPSANDLSAVDKRAPVLLLRSFSDEDIRVSSTAGDGRSSVLHIARKGQPIDVAADAVVLGHALGLRFETQRSGDTRLEEAITDQLSTFGPLVAIGKPGERLPKLGGARSYYTDADWKEAAKRWMYDARIIVAVAGLTGGLRWELDEVGRLRFWPKLMVIIPPSKEQLRWQELRQALRAVLPSKAIPDHMPLNTRVLHIDAEQHLVAVCSSGSLGDDYERAIRFAVYGMFCHANQFSRPAVH